MVRLSAPPVNVPSNPLLLVARWVMSPLMVLIGVSVLFSDSANRYVVPFGVALVAIGLGSLVQLVREQRWDHERPGPVLARDPSGAPSTLLVRAPWSTAWRWMMTAALAVPLALWVVVFLLDRQWGWAALFTACLAYVLVRVTPRGPSVGLHLTPEHLVLDDHGRNRVVPWSQVKEVVPLNARAFLRLRDGGKAHFVTSDLAVHPFLACLAIHLCVEEPETRAQLGTPASLEWSYWEDAP